jgi:hypothetical protein
MDGVLVAVGAEFLQLQSVGRVPTILGTGVARHSGRSLIRIGATLGTFQRNDDTNALSHTLLSPTWQTINTNFYFFIHCRRSTTNLLILFGGVIDRRVAILG